MKRHCVGGSAPRRGAILAYVAFLILALMGLVGLVVDLGIVRAGQASMQAGADTAALEGLRFRDLEPADPAGSDAVRRQLAAEAVRRLFDEDLDLATGAEGLLLGAGPTLSTGVLGVDRPAGGLLRDDGPFVPDLQPNASLNARHGDLVAGTYLALDPADPGSHAWHQEGSDYARNDFAVAAPPASRAAPAMLARVRRTNDRDGLDELPGVSSRGPTFPFLFALGSGVLGAPDPGRYDPRRDGLTARATAIADARPAVAVGLRGPAAVPASVAGLLEIGADDVGGSSLRVLALDDGPWTADVAVGAPLRVVVDSDGDAQGDPSGPSPSLSGVAHSLVDLVRVGEAVAGSATPLLLFVPPTAPGELVFVPLVAGDGLDAVVVGFGALEVQSVVASVDPDGRAVLIVDATKVRSLVATRNASAVPALAVAPELLASPTPGRALLLAPVLAR